jgi:hypothetical protein
LFSRPWPPHSRDKDGIRNSLLTNPSDPEKSARKILEIANSVEAFQDGRIHNEKINGPFLFREQGSLRNTALCIWQQVCGLVQRGRPWSRGLRRVLRIKPRLQCHLLINHCRDRCRYRRRSIATVRLRLHHNQRYRSQQESFIKTVPYLRSAVAGTSVGMV